MIGDEARYSTYSFLLSPIYVVLAVEMGTDRDRITAH